MKSSIVVLCFLLLLALSCSVVHGLKIVIVHKRCIIAPNGLVVCGCGGVTVWHYHVYGSSYVLVPDTIIIVNYNCTGMELAEFTIHELLHALLNNTSDYQVQYMTLYVMYNYMPTPYRAYALLVAFEAWYRWYREVIDTAKLCIRYFLKHNPHFTDCLWWLNETMNKWLLDPYTRAEIDFYTDIVTGKTPKWLNKQEIEQTLPRLFSYLVRIMKEQHISTDH